MTSAAEVMTTVSYVFGEAFEYTLLGSLFIAPALPILFRKGGDDILQSPSKSIAPKRPVDPIYLYPPEDEDLIF
jgi:hypothetical protein